MSERIVMRTGECLIAGGPPFTAAEPEVVIGDLDGRLEKLVAAIHTGELAAIAATLDTGIDINAMHFQKGAECVCTLLIEAIACDQVEAAKLREALGKWS